MFFSTMLTKVITFVISLIIIRIFTTNDYGNISYAFSIITLFVPVVGLGLHYSLVRFGGLEGDLQVKNNLFLSLSTWGSLFSLVLCFILIISSKWITIKIPEAGRYLRMFSPLMITFFLFQMISSYFRAQKNNKLYSFSLLLKAILSLIICPIAAYYFNVSGYIIAYVFIPFIAAVILYLLYKRQYQLRIKRHEKIPIGQYLKYGAWLGVGIIAAQLMLVLDVIMVGNILTDSNQLALYKVATIIPVNLLSIPLVLFTTDFVHIAEHASDRKFLVDYYKKYLRNIIPILLLILTVWFVFGAYIVRLFGHDYIESQPIISILFIMVIGAYIFRIPLANIISAVGKSKWNSYSNFILLIVNVTLNLTLIPRMGLKGAAIATTASIWTNGIINFIFYRYYLKRYCTEE